MSGVLVYLHLGHPGRDGGAGNVFDETRYGGVGRDRLFGGLGNDRVRTAGGTADTVDCGSGRDSVIKDLADKQKRCETVRRPKPSARARR